LKAKHFFGTILALSLLFLPGCLRESVPEVQHSSVAGTPIELEPGMTLGQTFQIANNNLYRVDIHSIVNKGHNGSNLYFHLKQSPATSQDLIAIQLTLGEEETGLLTATFPPIADSAGKSYYFYLDAPGAEYSPISLFLTQEDTYSEGSAYQNSEPVGGDLLFAAYSEDAYTPPRVFTEFLARASQDKPFFIFYLSLIGLVILALGFVLRRTPQRSDDE
jgi:hypothetical protein